MIKDLSVGKPCFQTFSSYRAFLNKGSIKLTLDHLPANALVLIDASDTAYIDYDVLEIIREFGAVKAPEKQIRVLLRGFHERYQIGDSDFVHSESAAPEEIKKMFTLPKSQAFLAERPILN